MATGLQLNLNRVIGRTSPDTYLDAQGAANVWLNSNMLNANLATGTDNSKGSSVAGIGLYNTTSATNTSQDYAQSGSWSLRVVPNASATTVSIGSTTANATYAVAVQPNTTYTLSFYVRTAATYSNTVTLFAIPQQVFGTSLTAVSLTSTTSVSSTDWTKVSGQFTTSSNHNYLVLRATVTGTNLTNQNYYFDTFNIQPLIPDVTHRYDLLGALNAKAETTGLGLNAVCNILADTTNLDADGASEYFS